MKLTIDRTQWLRGESPSYLLRKSDNKMCCLGFHALACGATKEDILSKAVPHNMSVVFPGQEKLIMGGSCTCGSCQGKKETDLCEKLMATNDKKEITEPEREAELTELFKELDVEVEFVN